MVSILMQNLNNLFYRFSIDSEDELDLLPRYGIRGKNTVSGVSSCCSGSKASCTNGTEYVLNGERNEWIKLKTSSGGGSGGGTDFEYTTNDDIDQMFK